MPVRTNDSSQTFFRQKTYSTILYVLNSTLVDRKYPDILMGGFFGNITIRVLNKDQPVAGAAVSFDNKAIGVTDENGELTSLLEESGMHTIYASKSGFATAARDLEGRVPFAEFKALD